MNKAIQRKTLLEQYDKLQVLRNLQSKRRIIESRDCSYDCENCQKISEADWDEYMKEKEAFDKQFNTTSQSRNYVKRNFGDVIREMSKD